MCRTACLHCADSVMCLLIERRRGAGWGGRHQGLLGCFPECLSATVTQSQPPSAIPLLLCSDRPLAKQRQQQPQHPKGPSLHQCLTSATASCCIPPPPPLPLSFFKAFLAILFPSSTESYCSRQQSRSFIFSLQPRPLYARRASITL